MTTVNEDDVRDALSRVMDPEAGMNIVDLGLVYGIDVSPEGVQVRLTMTSAACPMAEMIVDDAWQLRRRAPTRGGIVELVWDRRGRLTA
jgi:metal-sulfur cluster biosynthetic enzyme